MELEIVKLENDKEYAIMRERQNYLYLVNTEDPEDICIRKNVVKNGVEFIESLDSKEEFDEALKLFNEDKEEIDML
jgi:hypothetical protein